MEIEVYTRARWFILFVMVMVTAGALGAMISAAPLIPTMFTEMHWDPGATIAATMMAHILFSAVACFGLSFLIDKLGAIRCWIIGISLMIVGMLLVPVIAYSIPGLVCTRAFTGIGNGLILSTIASVCSQWFKYNERTYVAAFQGFAVNLGIGTGMVVSPLMFKLAGNWHTAFVYTSILPIIGLVFALIAYFFVKPPVDHADVITHSGGSHNISRNLKIAFGSSPLYILAGMWLIDAWAQQAFQDIAPAFYASPIPLGLGFDPLTTGALLMWGPYANMIGSLVAPVITEMVFKGSAKPTVFIGLSVSAVAMLGMRTLNADSGAWLVILPIIILFFSAFVNPTVVGYIAKYYPNNITGRLGGYFTGFGSIGATGGVAIGAYLLHSYNSYIPNMDILSTLLALGAVVVLFLKKKPNLNFDK
ncbi:MAG: rane protein, major facilitator superfamily [Firmicutes bacterium]|nr:rane protein, major facilitator superfamily [Bacillota bacterium]